MGSKKNRKSYLINVGLIEFTRRVLISGGISWAGVLRLPLYYIQLIPALPLYWLQRLLFGARIRKTRIHEEPVFILGHFRSGTTYLQKLMASTNQFGYLTNYDCLLPNTNLLLGRRSKMVFQRLLNLLRVKNPFFNNIIVDLEDPGEEDDYLMNKASIYTAYWGMIFPKRWREWFVGQKQFQSQAYEKGWKREYLSTMQYISYKAGGKPLVLKSPPNTERIKLLLSLFPKARFIYLHRNPYYIFYSMRNMWERAILNHYSLQNISKDELHELVFQYFEIVTEAYHQDKHLIPEGHLIEISYEELKKDPQAMVQKIFETLSLPCFAALSKEISDKIQSESAYKNFSYQFDQQLLGEISQRWKKYIKEGGYEWTGAAIHQ